MTTTSDSPLSKAERLVAAGEPGAAQSLLTEILATATPTLADRKAALVLRARAHEGLRNLPAAIADLQAALALQPDDPRIHNMLGILYADCGDTSRALAAFTRATELDAGYARAWNNLGNTLRIADRLREAVAAFSRAVAAQPDYALAWSNLGAAQRELGEGHAAQASLSRALALEPNHLQSVLALAGLFRTRGQIDDAARLFARAAELAPGDTTALLQLAGTLAERDELEAVRRVYAEVRARKPDSLRAAIGSELNLPMVYDDAAGVAAARTRYAEGIARLENGLPSLARERSFASVVDDLRWSNFLLAYQGEDDRELQARYARVVGDVLEKIAPQWRAPRALARTSGRRIRIGFASAFFMDGTVGTYFRRWIERLDRTRFDVTVYNLRNAVTPFLAALAPRIDRLRNFLGTALAPSVIAPAIRDDALDVLVYPELGMDATAFALGALRLAPVQCAAWGHPVTTGHSTIDCYFSCAAMEPDDADAHYTERLVRLPGIGTDYARPASPAAVTRASIGLPADVPLWLCPQSLFKIHPDNDRLFARALAAVPAARLVVFEGRHPALTSKYMARLVAACRREGVATADRFVVLPQCGHDQYLRINAACDAMLDTLRWSGGNTSLDALACGLPIVTLPGRFMRGRQSATMLALLGVDELVAADEEAYVRIAARLADDRDWREALSERIRASQAKLFDDPAPVDAFVAAIDELVRTRT